MRFDSGISAISGKYLETLSSDMQNFPLSFYCLGICAQSMVSLLNQIIHGLSVPGRVFLQNDRLPFHTASTQCSDKVCKAWNIGSFYLFKHDKA